MGDCWDATGEFEVSFFEADNFEKDSFSLMIKIVNKDFLLILFVTTVIEINFLEDIKRLYINKQKVSNYLKNCLKKY